MAISVSTDTKGFTLIEFLVAIVILMVGLLGLLQTVNYAIHYNMGNQLRQGALLVADESMNLEKAKPFDLISSSPSPHVQSTVVSRVVNGAFRSYSVVKTNADVTSKTKSIDLQVSWRYQRTRFVHSIMSLVSNY
ncbi:prepilin-type N-terminal cleavage/methylation domain-containing protein [Geobacter sp. AOG2]|uniref:type IV pilus modification PilV family protein n=1 Tax=Geobacter sp. AOG2 TaxID=1566347 RepID=UPI001CC71B53|nr:prepilin-type N-terminal cleavage/methylation domain-containing protein [Geobacter sp. AOG2]GFE61359.1 pilus assembly protein PilV [Geobacter sp. AOG2]